MGFYFMAYKRKTWREKLHDSKDFPRVVEIDDTMSKRWGTGTVVIPKPLEVDSIMKRIPKGKLITINQIREKLAKKHNATIGCPITTGIFARIAAEVGEEDRKMGKKKFTPYWRTLKTGGVINEKYPGGYIGQKKILEKEGHNVIQKGKKYAVENFEEKLVKT